MANSRFKYSATGTGAKPSLGKKSFHTPVRPGRGHTETAPSGAASVASANGKVHRPGGRANKVPRGAGNALPAARPGWREKI